MKMPEQILEEAKKAERFGTHRFCIVTSGGELSDEELEIALEAVKLIKENTGLKRCASLGALSADKARKLKEAGLNRYHHNLETSKSHFSGICSTMEWSEKVGTITNVANEGIEVCCGGIINLGETSAQRIEMAFELKELNPVSVPINFLNPRPGTPLENQPPLDALEAIKLLAIFRFILPKAIIRLAGGRCETLDCLQDKAVEAGINGLLIGDYLTTSGPQIGKDLKMLKKLGFSIK